MAVSLLALTLVLVLLGTLLYLNGAVGWAQGFWVMASGTAGAGVMSIYDRKDR